MLISFWWVVVAFILGGTGGVFALAVFAGSEQRDSGSPAQYPDVSPTR